MEHERNDIATAESQRPRGSRHEPLTSGSATFGEVASGPHVTLPDSDLLRLLVAAVEDYAIISLDVSGRVASWNEGARRLKGYDASEVLGRHFALFYPLDDIRSGKAQEELAVARDTGRFEEEGWRVRKGGERFWARVTLTAIRDAAGAPLGYVKVTHDLSVRERAHAAEATLARVESQLQKSEDARREAEETEHRLLALISTMSDGYFTLDEQWRFSFVNPALARLLGTPGRELVGRSFWDEVTDSVHSNFFKHLPSLLAGEAQVDFTEFHARTNRWFSVRAQRTDGKIVVFMRDVTDQPRHDAPA